MERNEQLFRDVADAIEQHPEQYDQGVIEGETACGTAYCIAGWAAFLRLGHAWQVTQVYCDLLGLDFREAWGYVKRTDTGGERVVPGLFSSEWRPHDGLSVPDALRKIGEGAAIEDVSA